jgi:hypothetical protein
MLLVPGTFLFDWIMRLILLIHCMFLVLYDGTLSSTNVCACGLSWSNLVHIAFCADSPLNWTRCSGFSRFLRPITRFILCASDSETELLHRKFESNNTQGADSSSSVAVINKARERPKRQIRKPARFQSSFESTQSETDSNYYKIKRVIGQLVWLTYKRNRRRSGLRALSVYFPSVSLIHLLLKRSLLLQPV